MLDHVRHGSARDARGGVRPGGRDRARARRGEAIALANDSDYGLGANIYTNNLGYVMQAMEEIKAGTFWVNDPLTDNEAGPFGGMRQSGIGRELGERGLDAFREPKHVHIDYIQERKSYWFPYANRKLVTDHGHPLPLYIGGAVRERRRSDAARSSTPRPAQTLARAARATAAETEAAIARGPSTAFDSGPWPGATARRCAAACCSRSRAACATAAAELARLETENMGKPIFESEFDVADAATCFEYYGGLATKITGDVNPVPDDALSLDAQGAGRRLRPDHPVELPAADGGVEDRAGAVRGLHAWCSSRPRPRRSPRSSWRASSTASKICRRAWSTS